MANKDYYGILGISKQASADEIKSAYRRMAKQYHPDVFATAEESKKKEAEEKFKEIQHAYDVLSDSQKKAAYDQYGSEDGPTMGGGGAGFNPFGGGSSIFDSIFNMFTGGDVRGERSGARAGDDIEIALKLTFKEACFGVEKEITFNRKEKCKSCNGTGAKNGTAAKTCSKCGGRGYVLYTRRTPFGMQQFQNACDACGGTGKIIEEKCSDCRGTGATRIRRTLKVKVPAGVDNGQMLTMRGEGGAGDGAGAQNGNLIVIFNVEPHALFVRDGINLNMDLPITIMQATLGAKVDIPTLTTPVSIDIPSGTQSGTIIRVKGKGVKSLRKDTYGDIYVRVIVEVPKNLSILQRNKLKEAEDLLSKGTYDKIEKYQKILRGL